MTIDYEALVKSYKFKNNPISRWKTLVIVFGFLTLMTVLALVVISILDPEFGDDLDLFIVRNWKYILGIVGILLFVSVYSTYNKTVEDKSRIKEYIERIKEYKLAAEKVLLDVKPITKVLIEKIKYGSEWQTESYMYYYWQDSISVHYFPCPPLGVINSRIMGINKLKSEIKYYEMVGEKFYENKIEGGGSEGPNVAGAIIGGQIMGTAGAIVGGQQKINPIESHLILHDSRQTRIIFDDSDAANELLCESGFYNVLKINLPEKTREIFDEIIKRQVIKADATEEESNFTRKFKLLEQLYKEGHLTKEKYDFKKKKLIDEAL